MFGPTPRRSSRETPRPGWRHATEPPDLDRRLRRSVRIERTARAAPMRLAYGGAVPILLVLLSCASSPERDLFVSAGQGADVRIVVDNRDFSDATIYVYWNGFKVRAGTVIGKSEAAFRLEWRNERLQLEADFVGVGNLWSDVVDVYPGDELKWLIQPQW